MKIHIPILFLTLPLLAGVHQVVAQVTFAPAANYGVGGNPRSVIAVDVNGDGKLDLISANISSNTLSILTNNGSGGFVLASSPDVGSGPVSVTAADVNADGKVDLISANSANGTLSVMTNNGSGVFGSNATYSAGSTSRSVTAADVNGDGKLDLIWAKTIANNTLSVMTNNGTGGFVLASSPVVGNNPYSVVAADVNGDGKVDLICANYGDDTLSVLINVPMLTINLFGNDAVVSWSSSWTNWTLQQNADLTTTNWSTDAGIANDGTNKSLIVTLATGNLFFRLVYP